jgi:uncharacterized RDD family membrane protein YckC
LNQLEETSSMTARSDNALIDLPLRHLETEDFSLPIAGAGPMTFERGADTAMKAGLASRAGAFVADAAMIVLIWAIAVLGAGAIRGGFPAATALPWAAAFAVLLSFFATVPALILFGRTIGMAVAGLAVERRVAGRRLTAGEAVWRWLGTLLTAATLGAALLFTVWSAEANTPADRLSGRNLVEESRAGGQESRV